jgi:hypothetical protein
MKGTESIFSCLRLPARLDARQTAELLGFQEHDIATLIREHLLVPLGKPAANAIKYFSTVEISALAEDRQWLSRATMVVYRFHQLRNAKQENQREAA